MPNKRTWTSKHGGGKLPPIAPREEQSLLMSESNIPQSTPVTDFTKNRLPPRSRNGCWTCRTRKVKCGEERPSCNQCLRLGHTCDYQPKLAFKDETPKIIHKYLGSKPSERLWDPTLELSAAGEARCYRQVDSLPPFTSLTTEEDWQKKAELQPPGTFFVVANSSSFMEGDEVQNKDDSRLEDRARNVSIDPGTLLLRRFEDVSQRALMSSTGAVGIQRSVSSTPSAAASPTAVTYSTHGQESLPQRGTDRISLSTRSKIPEPQLWHHYRTVVRHHMMQVPPSSAEDATEIQDSFEQQAESFPPLRHAILALSALSLFSRGGSQNVDSLQHYQLALSPLQGLRREEDLASDGAFLTHFVLLLYEIAGTDTGHFWSSHLASLTRIVQTRRRILITNERYPYVIWWICLIDVNALLSGSSKGEFIETMITNDIVPTGAEMRLSPSFLGSDDFFHGNQILAATWDLNREVVLAAADAGRMSRQMRQSLDGSDSQGIEQHWQQQSSLCRSILKRAWERSMDMELAEQLKAKTASSSVKALFDSTQLIYHACIIYTIGMMWPSQRLKEQEGESAEMSHAITAILGTATERLENQDFAFRCLVFPLLLAGIFVESASDKMKAQDLMQALEQESVGTNTRATCRLLELVYERQNQLFMSPGDGSGVDFIEIMHETGLKIVHFGF